MIQPDRPQMTIWRMRSDCWIARATDTHLEYVIIIVFPLQQWLQEHALVLRYTCIGCLLQISVVKIEKYEMGVACSAYGAEERRIQGFGGET